MYRFVGFLSLLFCCEVSAQTVIVIRHGQAQSNVKAIHSGDPIESEKYPLTEYGVGQVKEAASKLKSEHSHIVGKIRWIYTSPLLRSRQTATVLVDQLGLSSDRVLIDYAIKEPSFGDNEEAFEFAQQERKLRKRTLCGNDHCYFSSSELFFEEDQGVTQRRNSAGGDTRSAHG